MMGTKELNQNIKSGDFKRVYLLYGVEGFLLGHWQKRLADGVLGGIGTDANLNFKLFDGKVPVADIIAAAETMPFFSDHRLVLLKDTGLFEAGRKDDSEEMAKYIADIPDSTVLVFVEKCVDNRGRLFKLGI